MSNDTLKNFSDQKAADSPFLSLADGESAKVVKVREIKNLTKQGYGGEEVEVIRLVCDVEVTVDGETQVKIKNFDNGTKRFVDALLESNVVVGSAFTITREGEQVKTRYLLSNVVNPGA